MARLLLGSHPQGPYGLFISKPGIAVENTAPADTSNLLFSSEWGNIANIVASGTTPLNADVFLPAVGYRPFVRLDDPVGNGYTPYTKSGKTVEVSNGRNRRYDSTSFKVVYSSDTVFQVRTAFPLPNTPDVAGLTFRYVVLNFPVLA